MQWRRWNNILHRDLGYLCFGLTIIYVISGVAVNHIGDWNPTYRVTRESTILDLEPQADRSELIQSILTRLGETGRVKDSFQPDPGTLQIFVENNTIQANLKTGEIVQVKTRKRPLLFQVNFLHLNHPKKLWTWFADIYAIALGLLATTGLFMIRGRKGITGRGAWLVCIGIAVPLFFLWQYG